MPVDGAALWMMVQRQEHEEAMEETDEAASWKYAGVHVGRVTVRPTGWFDLKPSTTGERLCVNNKHCLPLHRADGYSYATGEPLAAAFREHSTRGATTEDA